MKQIKITFGGKMPRSFWESEQVQRMAPTPLFDDSCLIRLPERRAHLVVKALSTWMLEQGYQEYSIEQGHEQGR